MNAPTAPTAINRCTTTPDAVDIHDAGEDLGHPLWTPAVGVSTAHRRRERNTTRHHLVPPGKPPAAEGGTRVPSPLELARFVRTQAGARRYKLPIGSPIGSHHRLSDDEFDAHVAHVDRKTKEAVAAYRSTHRTEVDENGDYTPERAALHDQIVNELWNEHHGDQVPRDGHAIVAGGLAGAGKSTVLAGHAGVRPGEFLTVNADDAKDKLAEHHAIPEVEGLSPMEASVLVHPESGHIAALLQARARAQRTNLIIDTPMSSHQVVEGHLDRLRRAGYSNVGAVYVRGTIANSLQRSRARHKEGHEQHLAGEGHGGRYVPPEYTTEQANPEPPPEAKNEQVFNDLRDRFDEYGIWDNTGTAPVQVDGTGRWATSR